MALNHICTAMQLVSTLKDEAGGILKSFAAAMLESRRDMADEEGAVQVARESGPHKVCRRSQDVQRRCLE